jgi:Spy/CpxP family protein refolding chaperone
MALVHRALVVTLLALAPLAGCSTMAGSPPPEVPDGEEKKDRLPDQLEELRLSAEQRAQIRALLDQLKLDLEPVTEASKHLGRAIAVAARECKGASPFVDAEASATVAAGEQARPAVLASIQRLHRILTPAQRKTLSRRLLDDESSRKKDRSERDRSRAESLGGDLDLSVGQMFELLMMAQLLRSDFEDQTEPWRARYRKAVKAFAHDDFDIHEQRVAEAPLAKLGTDLVKDALKLLIPVLEPPQCKELGRMIDDALADDPKKKTKKQKKR